MDVGPRLTIERTLQITQSVTLRKQAFLCSKTVCVMSTNFCNPSFMMWYWGSLVMNQLHFEVYQTPRAINNAGQTSRFTTNMIPTKQNWQTIYRNWSQREFNSLVFKWMTLKPSKYCFLPKLDPLIQFVFFLLLHVLMIMTSKTSKDAATFGKKKTSNKRYFVFRELKQALREYMTYLMDSTRLVRYTVYKEIFTPILFLPFSLSLSLSKF